MAESLRLDKFLWFARIVKTRADAQALAEDGRLRINGRVAGRAHALIRAGDVLSFALRGQVRIIEVIAIPPRRGSPQASLAFYRDLPGEG